MDSQLALSRRLASASSLHGLVKTLKVMAAVNVRQFERALENLEGFHRTVEEGLQVVLREQPAWAAPPEPPPVPEQVVVLGSDQGLCGSFNEQLARFAQPSLGTPLLFCVGARLARTLEEDGATPRRQFPAAASRASLGSLVQELLDALEAERGDRLPDSLWLFYQSPQGRGLCRPVCERVLPVDAAWLEEVRRRPWDSRCLPGCWGDPLLTFSWLLRSHVVVALHRAMCRSLVSENATRLATLQGAEKSLHELGDALREELNAQRQNAVTEELLDLTSGFEVLGQAL